MDISSVELNARINQLKRKIAELRRYL